MEEATRNRVSRLKRSRKGLCDPCSDDYTARRAVTTCLTCRLSYCEKHFRRHYTSPRLQTHIISKAEQAAGKEHQRNTENVLPPPGEISFLSVKPDSVTLTWGPPEGLEGPRRFKVTWEGDGEHKNLIIKDMYRVKITGLQPGQRYDFQVATMRAKGRYSSSVLETVITAVPGPRDLTVERQDSSLSLQWTKPPGLQLSHQYLITYSCPGSEPLAVYTEHCCRTLADLQPGTHYTVGVSTVLITGEQSEAVSKTIFTSKKSKSSKGNLSDPVPPEPPAKLRKRKNKRTKRLKKNRCMNLLQKLGLSDMLPKRMQQRDVLVIDALSQEDKPPQTEKELSSQYLYKLMMLDYRARFLSCKPEPTTTASENVFAEDEDDFLNLAEETNEEVHIEEQNIHPMDLHMAVFHCADDSLRQYIYSKLSSCQFGLPLLVPNPFTQETEFPLWALRNIKKSWQSKSKTDSPGKYQSRHMFNTPVPVVSFIRLGKSSISKSQILNRVISKQKHNVFFHRHSKGSTRDCLLMDGVVEIAWYCPAGREDDVFDDCVAFLNLHGDARDHPQQLEFMQSVSTVNVVLLSEHPLEEKNKEIFNNLHTSPVPLIVLFSGQEKSLTLKNPTKVRLAAKNRNEAELNEEIISHIQHCVNTYEKKTSIKLFCDEARKHQFKVGEDKESCRDGREQAEVLMCLLREESSPSLKEKLLPLQGKLWHDWCQKDKDQYRLKCKRTESLECQLEAIMNEKADIRKAQVKAASPPNDFMKSFIKWLTSPNHSQETKLYMLQWLRMFLDEFNMDALTGYEEEYLSTWTTFKCGPKDEGGSTGTDPLLMKLNTISDKMTATTIGLQHIMRETSQMYEVFKPTKPQKETYELTEALPAIGAEMLMSGLPLELMDGDAAHVPLLWIQAVLDRLTETLGDKKVFVLSVLGLQSSGKSTLLNAMFGLQFTVSAGRCTRGAFMQLIKVDPAIVDQLKYEYVLVVDTEGLRSAELSNNTSLSHDNELATFIIGIGDITIINIMGENPSEMHDILQICVQAFLRMKQVKITPSCIFVHQNVAEASAGEKNMERRINLLGKLDTMAVTAAKEEQINKPVTGFSDIIQFDVKTQVFYFKGLLEGDPPMAPPNPSYSQNVQQLKNKVLSIAQGRPGSRFSTLSEVKGRIRDLWNGLLKENFVFSFRNTLERMVYSDLEKKVSEWSWKLRQHALEKEELHNQLHSNIIKDVNHKDLIDFDQVYNPLKEEKDTYFKENKNPEILIQWKVTVDKRLENLNEELIQNILKKCKDVITIRKSRSELADFLCKQLEPAIKQQMNQKTSLQISDLLRSNHQAFNGNRSSLENHILKHLAEKRSFKDYEEYIDQPKIYFQRFIQEEVEEYCTNDKMTNMLIENLHSLKSVILTVNTDVTAEVVTQRGDAKTWLDSFCKELGRYMVINREDLKSIEDEDIQNLTELKEMMAKCLNEMVMKMEKQEKLNSGKESFATLKSQVTEHLFDHHQGCWAKCPFCKAICTNTIPNHDGDHSVRFHRPEALSGQFWKDTYRFSIEFCTTSVSSNASFRYKTGVWPYKKYREAGKPYNCWSITADGSNQSYWKWFICTFQSQWENKKGYTFDGKGEIPHGWRQITLESALEELKLLSQQIQKNKP